MKTHQIIAVCRVALLAFFGLGLLSFAQGKGTVWVPDSFHQSGDRVGQFADRGEGKWDQVLKNGQRVHSFRRVSVTDQYVELSGDGGQVRLYANKALMKHGSVWQAWCTGRFLGSSPLQAGVDPAPPVATPSPPVGGGMDTRGIVWASSSLGQPGDRIGGFLSLGNGTWDQVMINGQKVHSYRQTGVTEEFVELSGSGGTIRLYRDKALMKKGNNWDPWTAGSFREDIRIPLPPAASVLPPTTPFDPPPDRGPDTGNAGILWVPEDFGRAGERIGQFVHRGAGKWDQVMKTGARIESYRETATTDEYVELSGSGTVIRLYPDRVLMERANNQRTWTYGRFQNGNPLQHASSDSKKRRFW